MPNSTFLQLERKIQSGNILPIYFLYGDEAFLINQLTYLIKKYLFQLKESVIEPSYTVLYPEDTTLREVISLASTYPMFSKQRMVVLKNFHKIKQTPKGIHAFKSYISSPLTSTVLVLLCPGLDKKKANKGFFKIFSSYAYELSKLNSIEEFATKQLAQAGWTITPHALRLFCAYSSPSALNIHNEVQKLMLYAYGRKKKSINEDDIANIVGISKIYNVYTLQKELVAKNTRSSSGIALLILRNEQNKSIHTIVYYLALFFLKLAKLHQPSLKNARKETIIKELGLYGGQSYFIHEYIESSKKFSLEKIESIIKKLSYIDACLKDINRKIPEEILILEIIAHICE